MRFLLTGLPATGKSTVAESCSEHFTILELGQTMARPAIADGVISDSGELAKLPLPIRTELQNAAIASADRPTSHTLVLAHLIVHGPEGIVPGFQRATIEAANFRSIVSLTAVERKLAERRSRREPLEMTVDEIALDSQLHTISATMWAQHIDIPLAFFDTTYDRPDETATRLRDSIDTVTREIEGHVA